MYKSFNCLKIGLISFVSLTTLNITHGQTTNVELPKAKQTTLGLYVTAKEAYEKWMGNPEKVKILDVRTPEEYMFIGHAAIAWNIPLLFQTYIWDEEKGHFSMKPNTDFMSHIKDVFQPDDIILVTCRSGGRSAMAVNQLAAAGFTNVYNITDGFEGDKVKDPNSVFNGFRMVNGWKNSGAPWTDKVDPKQMRLPK